MRFLWDLLFPPKCILCHKLLPNSKEDVCQACAMDVLQATTQHLRGRHFVRCVAPFGFEGNVRKSIHRYKFGGRKFYHKTYGTWLAACVKRELDGAFDLMTYVPISRRRMRQREYDQSQLLAERAGEILQIPVISSLKKVRDNPAQSGILDAEKRRKNVKDAYCAVQAENFAGKRVLLVDDVVTTGATLEECSKILAKSGAKEVFCATLAMTK